MFPIVTLRVQTLSLPQCLGDDQPKENGDPTVPLSQS